MQLPKELTTVTTLSKSVAIIMFISLPIIAFLFGMRYQSELFNQSAKANPKTISINPTAEPIACTMDAMICPDGTAVGRVAPNCEFEKCPGESENDTVFTGTISNINYECQVDGICSIGVGKGNVIIAKGEGPGEPEPRGTFPKGIIDDMNLSKFLRKGVEVFAKKVEGKTDTYTIFGSTSYYIKIIDDLQTFCGGIAGKTCPTGYYCKYEGTYPDAGGTCMKEKTTSKFVCPENEWVDCMPGPGVKKAECASNYLQWAQANCPDFKGAAL